MSKIIVTIGPETSTKENLSKILSKTNLFRLNLSHNIPDWHKKTIKKINNLSSNSNILIDIPGIKPRTTNVKKINIKKSQKIIFSYKRKFEKSGIININLSNPLPSFKKPIKFTLDDGRYTFKKISYGKNYITGISNQSFELQPQKGLNIPNSLFNSSLQEKKYNKYINLVKNWGIDSIGLSYIQNHKTIDKIKNKFPKLIITSKIENLEGLNNIEKICDSSDVIMIDRGDLSAELGEERLFSSILKIIKAANKYGKPVIMATENLDSMIIRSSPNKSEIMSLGLSRYFKVDCVMLSEETALSKNWQHTINWLSDYFNKLYSDKDQKSKTLKNTDVSNDLWNLVKTCENLRLVLFLKKGYALKQLSKIDKNTRIIIYTDNTKLLKLTKFYENIITFKIKKLPKKIEHKFIYENIKKNLKTVFGKEKKILVMYTAFARKNSRANSFSFLLKDDFFSWD